MVSFTSPLSILAIPAMWVTSYYPAFLKGIVIRKAGGFSNVQPRSNVALFSEREDASPELAAKLARMEGAHLNGLENLPFFGLAVLAGNYAGVNNYTLNMVSGLYILLRILYNYVYISHTTERGSALRTVVWVTSLGFPFYLLFKAVQLLSEKTL